MDLGFDTTTSQVSQTEVNLLSAHNGTELVTMVFHASVSSSSSTSCSFLSSSTYSSPLIVSSSSLSSSLSSTSSPTTTAACDGCNCLQEIALDPDALTSRMVIVTSPNYPSRYPDDANCIWRFRATRGTLKLAFYNFNIERDA